MHDHIGTRQDVFHRTLDLISELVSVCHSGARRDPDDHIGKVMPASFTHSQSAQMNRAAKAIDRFARG
jgi:hypothetical protein